jgi:integrase
MKHPFQHAGRTLELHKHDRVRAALRAGTLTPEAATLEPWYFTFWAGGKRHRVCLGTSKPADAVAQAKAALKAATLPDFAEVLEARRRRESLTVGALVDEWQSLRCPRPNGKVREPAAIARLAEPIGRALPWWRDVGIASIDTATLNRYADHRRATVRAGFTGERALDLELAALSACGQWAALTGRLKANPFASRPRFRSSADVVSCSTHMAADDDELHRLLEWFFAGPPARVVAGAHLCWCALTGLRPGEPGALRRQAGRDQAGERYTDGAGRPRMIVQREKRGQNPAITLHPAALDFLSHWESWLAAHLPAAPHLFPNPSQPLAPLVPFGRATESSLRRQLNAATAALELPHRKPHAMRAYYVRVRRGQGATDLEIAGELGQTGGSGLIERVYGRRQDRRGDAAYDWLPASGTPAWRHLTETTTANVVPFEQAV